jgi:hypothetical protein
MAKPDSKRAARLETRFKAFLSESRPLSVKEQKPLDPSYDPDDNPQAIETDLATLVKHRVITLCGNQNNIKNVLALLGNRKVQTYVGRNFGHEYGRPDKLLIECCVMLQCNPDEARKVEDLSGGSLRYDDYTAQPQPPKGFCWFENE